MNTQKKYGRAMLRGVEQFEVEREPSFFTTLLENEADEDKVEALITPKSIRKIGRRLLRIEVNPSDRDAAMAKLRSKDGNMVCHHAYRLPGKEGTRYYLTDQLIVRVLPRVDDPVALFRTHGLELHKQHTGIPGTFSVRITHRAGKNPLKVAQDLIKRPEIVYAEPNLVERFYLEAPPNSVEWDKLWHLDEISARQAWAHTTGIRDVVVAVVDDGCDLSHPAFGGSDKILHPFDFVDGDETPWSDYPGVETGKHGTPCAGLAVAGKNETGVIGVAPDCALMPVRMMALDRMELETVNVRDMFEDVGRQADVISNSWSCVPCYSPIPQSVADVFDKIVNEGGPQGRGAVICFAAGNHSAPIRDDDNRHFEYKTFPGDADIQVAQTKILNGYAAHPLVIAVAATTSAGRRAQYSNWGKEISVCAPSNNFDPMSDRVLPEKELIAADAEHMATGDGYVPGERVTGFWGTSGACPIVAGVAGLVRSVQPRLSAMQVKAIIEETADPVSDLSLRTDEERARARFIDGHSAWFGYGRVNAQKAVEKALLFQ